MAAVRPELRHDEPTLVDLYDRGRLLDELAEHCTFGPTPLVVGLHGDWGSGKTSFLCQLEMALTNQCPRLNTVFNSSRVTEEEAAHRQIWGRGWSRGLKVVWFEAWRYQHEPNPVLPLLAEVRRQFDPGSKGLAHLGSWFTGAKRDQLQGGLNILDKLIDHIGKVSPVIAMADPTIGLAASLLAAVPKQEAKSAIGASELREQLDHAISTIVATLFKDERKAPAPTGRKKEPRLVVIVDDLDRCEPEAAFRILESLKVYLNLKSTVFVLAMNQTIVEKALADRFRKDLTSAQAKARAREYLGKMCQNVWHLHYPRTVEEIVRDLAQERLATGQNKELLELAVQLIGKHCALPPTPRTLRSFVNVLERFAHNSRQTQSPVEKEAAAMVIAAYFYCFQPEFIRLLAHTNDFYTNQIVPFANGDAAKFSSAFNVFTGHLPDTSLGEMDSAMFDAKLAHLNYADPVTDARFHIRKLVSAFPSLLRADFEPFLRL